MNYVSGLQAQVSGASCNPNPNANPNPKANPNPYHMHDPPDRRVQAATFLGPHLDADDGVPSRHIGVVDPSRVCRDVRLRPAVAGNGDDQVPAEATGFSHIRGYAAALPIRRPVRHNRTEAERRDSRLPAWAPC